jgi:hypothetical protein
MPPRTNDFQKLVYLVQRNLAAGATVTESKMLTDRITRRKREVDICIEGHVGGAPVMVCVECRDHQRIADVGWVDQMKTKHDRLPTNALILASRRGFTPEARDVATSYGIKTVSLEEVDQVDFPALFGSSSSLWTKSITITATKVLVKVRATPTMTDEVFQAMPSNLIYDPDGNQLGQIGTLVELALKSPEARDSLAREGQADHTSFEMVVADLRDRLGRPFFMQKIDPDGLREIESMKITGPCKLEITQFGVRRGRLGDVHVAWGTTELLGRNAFVVATRDTAGVERLTIGFAEMRATSPPPPV